VFRSSLVAAWSKPKLLPMRRPPALVEGLLVLALAACVAGPDFQRPAPPRVAGFAPSSSTPAAPPSPDARQIVQGMEIPPRWWTLFGSPALDALVDQALANNPDVAAAEAALRQARELLFAQRAAYLPAVSAGFTPLGARNSATIAPPLADNSSIYSLYTAQLAVSYTPDVFGGTRRAVEAAAARADAQRFQTEAAYLSLTANVVQAALQESSLREQIAATREIIAAETRLLELMRRQHDAGQASGADVAAQEITLAQAQQSLPPLEKQLAQQRDLMAMLGGRYAADGPAGVVEISQVTLPHEVPVGLPSGLVERRPDIRAAEANLHAASAQVGVAAAARLPSITLTANGGSAASSLAGLTSSPNLFWTLAGGVAHPIFDAGALRHQQRAAEAAYAQAREQYRSTVLQAFQNVADALQALRIDDEALNAAVLAEKAAARSLQIAQRQVELGEAGAISVLTAEQAYHQSRIALIQARTGRYTDTVALYQALGAGGWPAVTG
jgi:NodT family efflux transporter outer membrane factor (OMF) lipoprotein